MIDIKILRENPELVKRSILNKGIKNFNFENLVSLDKKRLSILKEVEELRNKRNVISDEIAKASAAERTVLVAKASEIKETLKNREVSQAEVEQDFMELFLQVPTLLSEKMPIGFSEAENKILRGWSKKSGIVENLSLDDASFVDRKEISYLDHLELGKKHDMIDVEKSAEVSGSRFCYLKNEAVILQDAISYLMKKKLQLKGFMPIIPPILVKEKALYGTSHFPEGKDQVYKIQNENIHNFMDRFI